MAATWRWAMTVWLPCRAAASRCIAVLLSVREGAHRLAVHRQSDQGFVLLDGIGGVAGEPGEFEEKHYANQATAEQVNLKPRQPVLTS
ncbi:hypothetical protein OG816_43140 (plasmid) [Streptomyces sp. NBC_00073]